MPIQPTTLNHRLTTPNKLFEAMAAGVPVVASDLPGMATIVRETGCGRPRATRPIRPRSRPPSARSSTRPTEERPAYGRRAPGGRPRALQLGDAGRPPARRVRPPDRAGRGEARPRRPAPPGGRPRRQSGGPVLARAADRPHPASTPGYAVEIAAVTGDGARRIATADGAIDDPALSADRAVRVDGSDRIAGQSRAARPPRRGRRPAPIRVARQRPPAVRRWVFWPHTVRGWWATLERELAAGRPLPRLRQPDGRRGPRRPRAGSPLRPDQSGRLRRDRRCRRREQRARRAPARAGDDPGPRDAAGPAARTRGSRSTTPSPTGWRRAGGTEPPLVVPNWPEPTTLPPEAPPPDLIRSSAGSAGLDPDRPVPGPPRPESRPRRGGRRRSSPCPTRLLVPHRASAAASRPAWRGTRDPRFAGRHCDRCRRSTRTSCSPGRPRPTWRWSRCRPSRSTSGASTPNKFWEAIAAGTPVVVGPGLAADGRARRDLRPRRRRGVPRTRRPRGGDPARSSTWRRRPRPSGAGGSRRSPGSGSAGRSWPSAIERSWSRSRRPHRARARRERRRRLAGSTAPGRRPRRQPGEPLLAGPARRPQPRGPRFRGRDRGDDRSRPAGRGTRRLDRHPPLRAAWTVGPLASAAERSGRARPTPRLPRPSPGLAGRAGRRPPPGPHARRDPPAPLLADRAARLVGGTEGASCHRPTCITPVAILTIGVAVELAVRGACGRPGRPGRLRRDRRHPRVEQLRSDLPRPSSPGTGCASGGWVRRADAVVTVNDPIADHLATVVAAVRRRPTVLLNCQPRWTPRAGPPGPDPRGDRHPRRAPDRPVPRPARPRARARRGRGGGPPPRRRGARHARLRAVGRRSSASATPSRASRAATSRCRPSIPTTCRSGPPRPTSRSSPCPPTRSTSDCRRRTSSGRA